MTITLSRCDNDSFSLASDPLVMNERLSGISIPVCPLSGTSDVSLLAWMSTADIARLYQEFFALDIMALFGGVKEIGMWRSNVSDLIFFDPPVTGDTGFYEALSRIPWYYEEEKFEFRFARERIAPDARVLEVGCGPGFFGRHFGADRYVGLETSPLAREKATAAGLDVRPLSVETLAEREPGSFDAVVSFQVLEHVSDPANFLKGCARALRPGGTLLVSVPSMDGFMRCNLNDALNLPPHHVTRWSNQCLSWCAEMLRLELVELHLQRLSDGPHRRWFCKNLIDRALMRFVGVETNGPVTTDPLWFKFQPLSNALAGILEQGLTDPILEPPGHTVIAVMRKPD